MEFIILKCLKTQHNIFKFNMPTIESVKKLKGFYACWMFLNCITQTGYLQKKNPELFLNELANWWKYKVNTVIPSLWQRNSSMLKSVFDTKHWRISSMKKYNVLEGSKILDEYTLHQTLSWPASHKRQTHAQPAICELKNDWCSKLSLLNWILKDDGWSSIAKKSLELGLLRPTECHYVRYIRLLIALKLF